MSLQFTGKRAIITGAGKGIGRVLALKLSELGAEVTAISRTQADLDSLQSEDGKIKTLCVDVSKWDCTKQAIESVGAVDLLVNNAGIMDVKEYGNLSQSDVEKSFSVNVNSVINIAQTVAKGMKQRGKGGAIVNVSSILSQYVYHSCGVYCATKGAVDQLTRSMAVEFGPHQIRVNSVNPTTVRTALAEKAGILDTSNPEVVNVVNKIPLRRICALFCHGCVAVLKELHKVLKDSSGRKKTVTQKLDQLCQVNNFVSYTFSPPKMLKACNYIVQTHKKELSEILIEYYRKFKTSDNLELQESFCDNVIKACEGQRRPVKDSEMKPHGLSLDNANQQLKTMNDKIEAQVEDTIAKPPQHTTPIPKEEL